MDFCTFLGDSPIIRKILNKIETVALTSLTVIIEGESGTGKELVARLIHQKSLRKNKPLVVIDSGTIPISLAESELFGSEKGAYTGADKRKEGWFEAANGGTLFLDEITNLPDAIQIKLLRVLEEREVHHLGGRKSIRVDVRFIVSSNISVFEATRLGKFRMDLFHRLNEFNIALPPLRERKEDIPLLMLDFLKKANREFNKDIKGFSAEAVHSMMNYTWPGNVRELKNVVRRAVLVTVGDSIPLFAVARAVPSSLETAEPNRMLSGDFDLKKALHEYERRILLDAVERSGYNKTRAAKILNLPRKALYRKLKSLGIPLKKKNDG